MIRVFPSVPQDMRDWSLWINQIETQGNFIATLTGYASGPTGLLEWIKLGRRVTLLARAAAISGTSNATSLTITGMPTQLYPGYTASAVVDATDNGTTVVARAQWTSSTVITLAMGSPFSTTGFTGSGTKALPLGWSFSYLLEK